MDDQLICPVFPLELVQFPGALTPLHIFEARYRRMLEDVLAGDKTFGIICRSAMENGSSSDPIAPAPSGFQAPQAPQAPQVGCLVEVVMTRPLPDGRSNILCIGIERFTVLRHIAADAVTPYARAEVELFGDAPELPGFPEQEDRAQPGGVAALAEQTRGLFARMLAARQRLHPEQSDEAPDIPDHPTILSFIVAAEIDVDLSRKQRWLEMTETSTRLRELNRVLTERVDDYERQARVVHLSKTNGHAAGWKPLQPD